MLFDPCFQRFTRLAHDLPVWTICTRYFIYGSLWFIRVIIYQNIFNSILKMENYGNIEMMFENIY